MKKKLVKKLLAGALAGAMALGMLAGCGGAGTDSKDQENSGEQNSPEENKDEESQGDTKEDGSGETDQAKGGAEGNGGAGGTIMWLSNLSSGIQYEAAKAYAESLCEAWGYKFQVVYGDSFNDPAGNLSVVQNAMTDDVVGIVASQDGGLQNIMEEYPELYVAGYNTDMNNVYGEGGSSAACATNEKFLGTIADGHIDGADLGKQMFDMVLEKGYKKVSTIVFPAYAYPNLTAGDASFRAAVEEYNKSAAEGDQIEVVGEAKVLEFAPLEDSYFLDSANQDLDCIVALCAGVQFVYPALKSAVDGGTCSADTKMITSGFEEDSAILADIGGDGIIQAVTVSPVENIGWSLTMLDKALKGELYSDYSASERFDSLEYVMDSPEDVTNVMEKALNGTKDPAMAQITAEELQGAASYADLKALFMSEQLTVEALAK